MKEKILKISVLVIMLCLVFSNIVNALGFVATMTPSSTTVAEATEFTVKVKVSNLDVGSNGINSLTGYLKYDKQVFENISDSSIEGLNNWNPQFNADNGKITLTKNSFVKADEDVFQVTFKTLSGVTGKTGNISYQNIDASNSEDVIRATDISTTITVGTAPATPTNTTKNTNTQGPVVINPTVNKATNNTTQTPATTNTPVNSVVPTNNTVKNSTYVNTQNTTPQEDIPYTGVEDTLMYVIIVALAISLVFYIKFERINKEM